MLFYILGDFSALNALQKTRRAITKKVFKEAIDQKNIGLASIYLTLNGISGPELEISSLIDSLSRHDNIKHLVENKLDLINYNILLNQLKSNTDYIDALIREFDNICQLQLHTASVDTSQIYFDILCLKNKISKDIFEYVQTNSITRVNESYLKDLAQQSKSESLVDRYYEECIYNMRTLSNYTITMNNKSNSKQGRDSIGAVFYDLASFCYGCLNNSEINQPVDIEKTIISSILRAMCYESKEARRLFPCLLELTSLKNGNNIDQEDLFKENVATVPEWMFINWIPQILSYMNISRTNHLDDILHRIALYYPNALKHSFDLWYENLKGNQRFAIKNIKDRLHNDITQKFVESFKYLCVPEILLKTYLKSFYKSITKGNLTQEEYISELENMLKTVFTTNGNLQVCTY